MKAKELIPKKDKDLIKELIQLRKKLNSARMDIRIKKQKNYKELLVLRKDIARIQTVLSERKIMAAESKAAKPADQGSEQ